MTPRARGAWALVFAGVVLGCRDTPGSRLTVRAPSALVDLATAAPDSTRDAIARALQRAAATRGAEGAAHIGDARRHASAYAQAWSDSFFVRRVATFESAPLERRRAMVAADSLFLAGRVATGAEGILTAMALWRRSLDVASRAGDEAAEARALYGLGYGFGVAGAPDSARAYLDRAYALAAAVGDHRSAGNALGILASMSKDEGDLARAAELYEKTLGIRKRSGDERGMAADENNLGLVALALGDLERARAAFEHALSLNEGGGRTRPAAVNLTNLGDVATLLGDYASAESRYRAALDLNRADGDVAESAYVLHDLGRLATRRGDYVEAVEALSPALEIHEGSGAVTEAALVRADLATARAAAGDFEGARSLLEHVTATPTVPLPPAIVARLEMSRADLEVRLGAYARADAAYGSAERSFGEASDEAGRAEALEGRALLQLVREEPARALELFELAGRARAGVGDPRAVASTRMLRSEARRLDGDTAAARLELEEAEETFEQLGDRGGRAASLAALGDLARMRGAPLAAEAFYHQGLEVLGPRAYPDVAWRLRAGLGAALRTRGALVAAAEELRAAVASVEGVAYTLQSNERATGFLADKWHVYGDLAGVEQQLHRPTSAFAVSERMRARQMLTLLDRGRVPSSDPETAREQDLRRRIGELMQDVAASDTDRGALREPSLSGLSAAAAREALDAAQREYTDLLLELADDRPSYARLATGATVDWRAVADGLGADEILLQYLLTDSTSTVFVVTPDTVAALDLGVGRSTISDLVDFARHAMEAPDSESSTPLWRGVLRRLYDYLIGPVADAGYFDGVHRLVIVPHAELHFLPFGALLSDEERGGFLVERFELTYAPSASVWVHLEDRARRPANRVLALAPYPGSLRGSTDELAGIAASYERGSSTLLMGPAASEVALRARAPDFDVVHLATFGVLNKHNPLFSHVELAAGGGEDGRLEVHEVFDLDLDGQLVVLSACQTALGSGGYADVPPGDEWIGLLEGFLQAGAATVVASLWAVDDAATAEIMTRFHRALATGSPPATALAEAQRSMLRDPHTAHPSYWAAFVASGAAGSQ